MIQLIFKLNSMKIPRNVIFNVIETLLTVDARTATKYLDEKTIVRASRKVFKGKFSKGNVEIILTFGKPNFKEREFIKKCKKVGEPFPVKKIQLKFPVKK